MPRQADCPTDPDRTLDANFRDDSRRADRGGRRLGANGTVWNRIRHDIAEGGKVSQQPRQLILVLGNQLFPPRYLDEFDGADVFMAEHRDLCTDVRHHKQKIVLFFAAMRAHADALRQKGFRVHYRQFDPCDDRSYLAHLESAVDEIDAQQLVHFEIEDRPVERQIIEFAIKKCLDRRELSSPMFLCSRARFQEFAAGKQELRMADFYRGERRRLKLLLNPDGRPRGGKWSLDAENRKKLPKVIDPPQLPKCDGGTTVVEVIELVEAHFPDHPGSLDDFNWPTTRRSALYWLRSFLDERLELFGPYEDAISSRSNTVFHSVLSPALNLGLITPDEVVKAAVEYAEDHDVPLQSIEGFVRQVIGWREFIRGVYRCYGKQPGDMNFFDHQRELTDDWYKGSTGLPPLDDAIRIANQCGWTHHIQRLMVVANLMTLCEIRPTTAYRWFMEMFVDSAEWVMVPNVYGMGIFSDGGLFATKPYICGSNYLRKMSDYSKGPWCDTVDGLYWRFIDRHRDYFVSNARLALMPKALDRLDEGRRSRIFAAAEDFLATFTVQRRDETD